MNPQNQKQPSVAIIGAGISGLTVGRILADQHFRITIFEKSRGPGGRMSTRRDGIYAFDHGAQFIAPFDATFRQAVSNWNRIGLIAAWNPYMVSVRGADISSVESLDYQVALPGMSAVCRHLADTLPVIYRTEIRRIELDGTRWNIRSQDGQDMGTFDSVVITAPPPQAAALLHSVPDMQNRALQVEMVPCWAVMAVFEDAIKVNWDVAVIDNLSLRWIARNSSKPGRTPGAQWVLHASPQWSIHHLEEEPGRISDQLIKAFWDITDTQGAEPEISKAHRWRYATAASPMGEPCLWDHGKHIGVCGDWCLGITVEAAYLSGLELADRMLATLRQ